MSKWKLHALNVDKHKEKGVEKGVEVIENGRMSIVPVPLSRWTFLEQICWKSLVMLLSYKQSLKKGKKQYHNRTVIDRKDVIIEIAGKNQMLLIVIRDDIVTVCECTLVHIIVILL